MRLHDLFESTNAPEQLIEDRIDIELGEDFAIEGKILEFADDGSVVVELDDQAAELVNLDEEVLKEFIPLAIAAAGLGMTAYDAYRNYRAYKKGEISRNDLAKRIGTDAAIGLISGGVGKLASKAYKGAKAGVKALRGKSTPTPKATTATPAAATATATTAKQADDVAATTAKKADDAPTTRTRNRRSMSSRIRRAGRRFGFRGGMGSGGSDYTDPLQTAVGKFATEDKDVYEGAMSNIHARISSADDPAEEIYKMMNDFDSPEGEYIRREYEITAGENGLHGDDDMETIIDIMVDDMGLEESKSQGDAWYIEQDAKRMAEKDGHDWSSLPYGRKSVYRSKAAEMRQTDDSDDDDMYEAEYQGRKVKLGKPMAGDVKKFKVYVKNPKGNVVKVNFGQKGVKIKKSNPKRRKSFRARHNCDNPGPRHKARYWSCRKW